MADKPAQKCDLPQKQKARELAAMERAVAADPGNDIPDNPQVLAARKAEIKEQLKTILEAEARAQK